jgi:hypothetical protein
MNKKTLAAALSMLALAGCSRSSNNDAATTTSATTADKAAGGVKGSCNLRKEASTCNEETQKSDPLGLSKGLCEALKGVWIDGKCPQDSVVGTCADKDGSMTYYYSDGQAARDVDAAKSSCEIINEGKFTAVAAPAAPSGTTAKAAPAATTPKPKPIGPSKPKH